MPYPNEHAARLHKPLKKAKYRRQNDRFGKGRHAIWMVDGKGKVILQAIRFNKNKYTVQQAKAWLDKHNAKVIKFEKATGYKKNPGMHQEELIERLRAFVDEEATGISDYNEFMSRLPDTPEFDEMRNDIRKIAADEEQHMATLLNWISYMEM